MWRDSFRVAGFSYAFPRFGSVLVWIISVCGNCGTSVVAGISLSSAMIESAELPLSSHRRTVVTIASLIGLVVGGVGFVCQVVRSTEWFAGISLGSCFVEAVSTNVTVGLFCLVASALFCVLGVRSKDKGYYSVISVASSIVALFCLFIVLYTAVPW